MDIFYVFKFLRIWAVFASVTLIFSFLLMFCTYNIFDKAGKKASNSYIPVYNLLILLDIVELSRMYFLLLLLPVVNVFVIFLIMYRLSIVFHTSKAFALGLILFAIIFLPMLNFSKDLSVREEEKDDVSADMVSILTEQQFNDLNKAPINEPVVDNVFKTRQVMEAPAPAFRANRVKYKEMVQDVIEEEKTEVIKRVEPVMIQNIQPNKFINESIQEEDDSIEIVEL